MRPISFLLALLFSLTTYAANLAAPFSGSRLDGLTRSSTIFESDSTVDASGNLVDKSGSNYSIYSEQFDNAAWTKNTYSAVVANAIEAPDGTLTAEAFKEFGAGGGGVVTDPHLIYIASPIAATSGASYIFSVYVKAAARDWVGVGIFDSTTSKYFFWSFDVANGVLGSQFTTGSDGTPANKGISCNKGWCRCWVEMVATGANNLLPEIYILKGDNDGVFTGSDQVSLYTWGAQLSKTDSYRKGPGIYHPTAAANKPLLDLAPTNSPTESSSYLQAQSGRRLKARTFNGTTQFYAGTFNNAWNIFDGNHTITYVSRGVSTGTVLMFPANNVEFGKAGFQVGNSNSISYFNAATTKTITGPLATAPTDGYYHVHQIVCRNRVATFFTDGVASSSSDITTFGIDATIGIPAIGVGSGYFGGSILYTRIDAEALSDAQLAAEREVISGTLFGSGNLNPGSTFSRTTTATQTFSDGTLGYVAAGVPRISGDGGGVLVEGQRTNLALQSQTFDNGSWTRNELTTINANAAIAPDGTLTADGLVATVVDDAHRVHQACTTVVSTIYTQSVFAKAGSKNWLYLSYPNLALANSYFNLSNCTLGTKGAGASNASIQAYGNGWCRCSITVTGQTTTDPIRFMPADADLDAIFVGDTVTNTVYLWGAQLEAGSHPTSYIPTTTIAVTRTADSLTIEPWKLTKPSVGSPMFAMYFDDDVYSTGTYTSEVGGYAFTVNGDTKHVESQTLGDYFSFDGSGDYLTRTSSDLYPSTSNFSMVAIYTPTNTSGAQFIFQTLGSGGYFSLYQNGTVMTVSTNDGSTTDCVLNSALTAGKTSLITTTFTRGDGITNSSCAIMVDALTAGTSAVMRKPGGTGTVKAVGSTTSSTFYLNGKLHYLAYYDHGVGGAVLTQAQHDAMYANLKQANVLPVKVGTSYEAKKLYVEFESKCKYAQTGEISMDRSLLEISGNTGTAAATQNRVAIQAGSDGKPYLYFWDSVGGTTRYLYLNSALTTWDEWKKHKVYLNLSDLSLSTYSIDGTAAATGANMTSAYDLDMTNTLIRAGQRYSGTPESDCSIRNLRIRATP